MVGHSYGAILALELASSLEKLGKVGHIFMVDGSFDFCRGVLDTMLPAPGDEEFENKILFSFADLLKLDNLPPNVLVLNRVF